MNSTRKIIFISLLVSCLGIFIQVFSMFDFVPSNNFYSEIFKLITVVLPSLDLSFFNSNLFIDKCYNNSYFLFNFFDLCVFLTILLGVFLYKFSDYKEIRLLRFSFSIVFLSKILHVFIEILKITFFYNEIIKSSNFSSFNFIVYILSNVFWAWISYYVLSELSRNISLDYKEDEKGNIISFVETPKVQRLLHHILDLMLSILICSGFYIYMFGNLFEKFSISITNDENVTLLLAIFSRITYLIVFEYLFNSTPAKFFTGSILLMKDRSPVTFKTVFLRTLCRFIPFEPFTYLGKGNGLHDKLLKTIVVKEKNYGYSINKYAWIIVFYLLIGLLVNKTCDKIKSIKFTKAYILQYNKSIDEIEQAIRNHSVNHFFQLTSLADKFVKYYFKIEDIKENKVTFKYFSLPISNPIVYQIERFYENNKSNLPSAKILYDSLKFAYTKKYYDFVNMRLNGIKIIPELDSKFYISKVFEGYKPLISEGETIFIKDDYINIELVNEGWPAYIIDIENIEGDLEWLNVLPSLINPKSHNSNNKIYLIARKFKTNRPYKFYIIVRDTLEREEKYLIKGFNLKINITKL